MLYLLAVTLACASPRQSIEERVIEAIEKGLLGPGIGLRWTDDGPLALHVSPGTNENSEQQLRVIQKTCA